MVFGLIAIILFFGIFGLWSVIAKIDSAAVAEGFITVESNRKTIQHLEGGIVRNIFVKEGEEVKSGQPLMKLDDTQANASLEILQSQLNELMAEEARLVAERDGDKAIEWPEALKKQQDKPGIKKLLKSQQAIFISNKKTIVGQVEILKQRIGQLEKEIDSLRAQTVSQSKQLELIEEEIVAVAYLEKKKLIERSKLLALQREAARLEGNRDEHLGLIAKTEQKIGETKLQIITVTDTYLQEILTRLREIQGKLADLHERFHATKDILSRTLITAPQSGRVLDLKQHTIGGVVRPGDAILDIVPSQDQLIIEARINPLDIDIVHAGLEASIRLTALKQRYTPILTGEVIHVSADRYIDQNTQQPYFKAFVTIDAKEVAKIRGYNLYPGMPVTVMIVVDKRSPLSYFMSPIYQSFWQAFREQ